MKNVMRRMENENASKFPPDILLIAAGRLGGRLLASVALTDARRFAAQGAQEIKFGAADAAMLDDVNVIDNCRMERKDALDADAERGLAHSDRLTDALAAARDHDSLEGLQPFLGLALLDSHVNPNGVAGNEIRDVALQLRLFDVVQIVHCSSPQNSKNFQKLLRN